uniref:Uncharacterized protein n=1 Tax=Arundo donax TaxID=35708 RepID=A0A0A8Z0U4_ARUDO
MEADMEHRSRGCSSFV